MTPRFLAQAIGWVEVPFTNMGDRERNGRSRCGMIRNQAFNFRHVKFEM